MNRTIISSFIAIVAVLLFTGCGPQLADLPVLKQDEKQIKITVLRKKSMIGALNPSYISVDGKTLVYLNSGEYTTLELPFKSKYLITLGHSGLFGYSEDNKLNLHVSEKEQFYFYIKPSLTDNFKQIDENEAKLLLNGLKYVQP